MSDAARMIPATRWSWLLPALGLLLVFHFSPFGATLDRSFFDAASRRPLQAPPLADNSAVVLVDEQTMSAMSEQGARWPFPRVVFAQLIAALHQAGASRVLVDFTFLEESSAAEQDLLLAEIAAAAPSVVLARTADRNPVFWPESFVAQHPALFSQPRTGLVDFKVDDDGVARSYLPKDSLVAAALPHALLPEAGLLRWHGGLEQIRAKGVPVLSAAPYIAAGRPILERIAQAAPDLSAAQVAQALVAEAPLQGPLADAVKGRIVFVGANASGTFDVKPMPVGRVEPGVLLHWTAWTNLASGGFIQPVPRPALWIAVLLVVTTIIWAGRRQIALQGPLLMTGGLVFLLLGGAYALLSVGWFLPPATPVAAGLLTLLGVVAESFWREQARKREIQAMFGAYVDPAVVATLVRNPEAIRLGGERREATVFFSDLAGFTDLSEKLRDQPERMVEVVNAYLEDTSECLHNHGAYVDKYIGDAVMAVFGVPAALPDHALAACRAALEARQALARINTRYAALGVELEVRIGLNTGEMIVGNLGSSRKKNYTVMGDAVNLASRLEGANKEFGTNILLGETTARAVAGRMATRPLTRLRVKGKLLAVEVHELVGAPEDLTPAERDFLAAYNPGYAHFAARRFAEAAGDFGRALALRPADAVTGELLRQAQRFAAQPPPPDWEPILILESK
ncbi:MAG TPA: adenylate/guanylate cyclase domain-containing protein [Lacunisphaera sp.]